MNGVLYRAGYETRRVFQTGRTFANWPRLLRELGAERAGRGAAELTFVTRSGARLSCPNVPGARLPMYEQFADDCYDRAWLLASASPLTVLDVGAHVGAFAVNLATARPDVRVECYEPSPETAQYLRRNVAANGLGERVRVHECALADVAGTALLDDNSGASVHNGLVRYAERLVGGTDGGGRRDVLQVPTATFAQALAAAPAPIELVKLDCEGGEYALVSACTPQDWTAVQRVVLEYHPVPGQSWDELRDWFAGAGLHVVRHKPGRPGLGTAWLARS